MSRQQHIETLMNLSEDSKSDSPIPIYFRKPSVSILGGSESTELTFSFMTTWVEPVATEFSKYASYDMSCELSRKADEIDQAIDICQTGINEAEAEFKTNKTPHLIVILLFFHYTIAKIYENRKEYDSAKDHCLKAKKLLDTKPGHQLLTGYFQIGINLVEWFEILYLSFCILNDENDEAYERLKLNLIKNTDMADKILQIVLQNIANEDSADVSEEKTDDKEAAPTTPITKPLTRPPEVKSDIKMPADANSKKPGTLHTEEKSIPLLPINLFYEFDEKHSTFGVGAKWSDALPSKWEKYRAVTKNTVTKLPKDQAVVLLINYINELKCENELEGISVLIIMHRTLGLIYKNNNLLNEAKAQYLKAHEFIKSYPFPKQWEIANSLNLYTLNLAFKRNDENDEAIFILRSLLARADFKPFERDILIKKLNIEDQMKFMSSSPPGGATFEHPPILSTKEESAKDTPAKRNKSSTESDETPSKKVKTDVKKGKDEIEISDLEKHLRSMSLESFEVADYSTAPEMIIYHDTISLIKEANFHAAIDKCKEVISQLEKIKSNLDFQNYFLFLFHQLKAIAHNILSDTQGRVGSIEIAAKNSKISVESIQTAGVYMNSIQKLLDETTRLRHARIAKGMKEIYSLFESAETEPFGMEILKASLSSLPRLGQVTPASSGSSSASLSSLNRNLMWQQPQDPTSAEPDEDQLLQAAIELSMQHSDSEAGTEKRIEL